MCTFKVWHNFVRKIVRVVPLGQREHIHFTSIVGEINPKKLVKKLISTKTETNNPEIRLMFFNNNNVNFYLTCFYSDKEEIVLQFKITFNASVNAKKDWTAKNCELNNQTI